MGGIAECGVSVDTKASPRRAAIEKAQEELRQEYDVREERRRELEFLEKVHCHDILMVLHIGFTLEFVSFLFTYCFREAIPWISNSAT